MKKKFSLIAMVLSTTLAMTQVVDVSVYADCSKNGYTREIHFAPVSSTSGRTLCEWVQLWQNGPKWATFNVGATITDYANLTIGADSTSFHNYTELAPYYNTANVGGLYPWKNPNLNGRKTTWKSGVSTGISDVATSLWGSNWKTPTRAQLDTLCNEDNKYGKTTWTWCDGSSTQYVKGCTLAGYKVSGVGKYSLYSIFLPAAGYFYYFDGSIYDASHISFYWSSTEVYWASDFAHYLYFSSGTHSISDLGYYRIYGYPVRAILEE